MAEYASVMVRRGTASTLAADVHELLRREITLGLLRPGERLKPADLASRHCTSTTVVRDALGRLVAEKLVVTRPNQGFFVLNLDLRELEDLTRVRVQCDGLALQLAIERGDLTWETAVMSAQHVLTRTPRRLPQDPRHTSEGWAKAHRDFHHTLVSACRVPLLLDLSWATFDSTELYRRWSAPSVGAEHRCIDDEHDAIVRAALARDAPTAIQALRMHYERTLQIILDSGVVVDEGDAPLPHLVTQRER